MAIIVILLHLALGGLGAYIYYGDVNHKLKSQWKILDRKEVLDETFWLLMILMTIAGPAGLLGSILAVVICSDI